MADRSYDDFVAYEDITEKNSICKDCEFRGSLYGWPVSKCGPYPELKPIALILGTTTECPYYKKDKEKYK